MEPGSLWATLWDQVLEQFQLSTEETSVTSVDLLQALVSRF